MERPNFVQMVLESDDLMSNFPVARCGRQAVGKSSAVREF
jgi:hypothetical protein